MSPPDIISLYLERIHKDEDFFNLNFLHRSILVISAYPLDGVQGLHSSHQLTKHSVLVVKMLKTNISKWQFFLSSNF